MHLVEPAAWLLWSIISPALLVICHPLISEPACTLSPILDQWGHGIGQVTDVSYHEG